MYEYDYFLQCNITKIFRNCKQKREWNDKNARTGGWGKRFYLFCSLFPLFGPAVRSQKILAVQSGGRKIKELKRKLFCFARRVSAGGNAGAGFQIIRAIFARKRFELRSAIAINSDISNFQRKEFARSSRLRRVSLRKKPCISELNRKVGQIQIQFFEKANGGSTCKARNKQSLFPIFFHSARGGMESKFFNPALLAKGDIIN